MPFCDDTLLSDSNVLRSLHFPRNLIQKIMLIWHNCYVTCLVKLASSKQVRDMTAFLIHYCIVTHIKITIQSLYCNRLSYCDHNTDSPFFIIISFITLPDGHIDIANAEINIYI